MSMSETKCWNCWFFNNSKLFAIDVWPMNNSTIHLDIFLCFCQQISSVESETIAECWKSHNSIIRSLLNMLIQLIMLMKKLIILIFICVGFVWWTEQEESVEMLFKTMTGLTSSRWVQYRVCLPFPFNARSRVSAWKQPAKPSPLRYSASHYYIAKLNAAEQHIWAKGSQYMSNKLI